MNDGWNVVQPDQHNEVQGWGKMVNPPTHNLPSPTSNESPQSDDLPHKTPGQNNDPKVSSATTPNDVDVPFPVGFHIEHVVDSPSFGSRKKSNAKHPSFDRFSIKINDKGRVLDV